VLATVDRMVSIVLQRPVIRWSRVSLFQRMMLILEKWCEAAVERIWFPFERLFLSSVEEWTVNVRVLSVLESWAFSDVMFFLSAKSLVFDSASFAFSPETLFLSSARFLLDSLSLRFSSMGFFLSLSSTAPSLSNRCCIRDGGG
jgi:hypothetical protein